MKNVLLSVALILLLTGAFFLLQEWIAFSSGSFARKFDLGMLLVLVGGLLSAFCNLKWPSIATIVILLITVFFLHLQLFKGHDLFTLVFYELEHVTALWILSTVWFIRKKLHVKFYLIYFATCLGLFAALWNAGVTFASFHDSIITAALIWTWLAIPPLLFLLAFFFRQALGTTKR